MADNLTVLSASVNMTHLNGHEETIKTIVTDKIAYNGIFILLNGTPIGHLYEIRDETGGGLEIAVSIYDDEPSGSFFKQIYDAGQVQIIYNLNVEGTTKGNGDYTSVTDVLDTNIVTP